MPWVGETFQRTDGTRSGPQVWQDARTAGVKIVADGHDTHDEDMASAGITDCVRKSGQNTATADLPMGGFKHTNVADALSRNQYASAAQVQDGGLTYASTVGGTGDAVTLALAVAPSNYIDGMRFSWIVAADNTGAVTVNVNGLGVKDLEKTQFPMDAGDLITGNTVVISFDGARDAFQVVTPVPVETPLPPSYIDGNTLSTNVTNPTTDVDISAGSVRSEDNTANIVGDAITKKIDAVWAEGTDLGGLDTGAVAADSAYDVYRIKNSTTGTVDALFVLRGDVPVMPIDYDERAKVGECYTDVSSDLWSGRFLQIILGGKTYESEPQDTTSGTSWDWLTLPSGSKRITTMLKSASGSGISGFGIRIGSAAGMLTTGYQSGAGGLAGGSNAAAAVTNQFMATFNNINAASEHNGAVVLNLQDEATNEWASAGSVSGTATHFSHPSGGGAALPGEIDRLQFRTQNGTDTGNNGSVNIKIEF